ncbi:hypothetical protein NL676_028107 [Syzygium grande]|nr:hypothetical protein NL676_028107 [Syzygium grande]
MMAGGEGQPAGERRQRMADEWAVVEADGRPASGDGDGGWSASRRTKFCNAFDRASSQLPPGALTSAERGEQAKRVAKLGNRTATEQSENPGSVCLWTAEGKRPVLIGLCRQRARQSVEKRDSRSKVQEWSKLHFTFTSQSNGKEERRGEERRSRSKKSALDQKGDLAFFSFGDRPLFN